MFEVRIGHTFGGVVFRFMDWAEAETFVCLVLGNGWYEGIDSKDEAEHLSVTIVAVDGGDV